MNWGFLLFRGSYTYKKGLIVQSSSKTTQLLDPLHFDSYRFAPKKKITRESDEIQDQVLLNRELNTQR